MESIEEPSEEGGASMPDKVGKQCHLLESIVEGFVIATRCAEKEASRLLQADNSQTTPPTLNTMTTVDYS